MKPNQRLTLIVLLALLIAAVAGLVLTRDSAPPPGRFRRGRRFRSVIAVAIGRSEEPIALPL